MKRKAIITCLIILLLTLVFASCSRGGGNTQSSSGKVNLVYLHWGNQTEKNLNQKWVNEFEKLHPGITVTRIVPAKDFTQKLLLMIAGNEAPDVTYLGANFTRDLVEQNVYVPLDELLARDKDITVADYFPLNLDALSVDGKLYGLPRTWHPELFIYNKAHFQRASLPEPRPSWTLDQFVQACRKLQENHNSQSEKRFALSDFPMDVLAWTFGGKLYDDKGNSFYNTPAVFQSYKTFHGWRHRHKFVPTATDYNESGFNSAEAFYSAQVSLMPTGLWLVPDLRAVKGLSWDIVNYPRHNGHYQSKIRAGGWGMTRASKHKKEAWLFMKYLASKRAQRRQITMWRDPSGRKDMMDVMLGIQKEQAPFTREVILDSMRNGRLEPSFLGKQQFMMEMGKVLGDFVLNAPDVTDEQMRSLLFKAHRRLGAIVSEEREKRARRAAKNKN
jgi:multiple sugar transport system substrate-binding protein